MLKIKAVFPLQKEMVFVQQGNARVLASSILENLATTHTSPLKKYEPGDTSAPLRLGLNAKAAQSGFLVENYDRVT